MIETRRWMDSIHKRMKINVLEVLEFHNFRIFYSIDQSGITGIYKFKDIQIISSFSSILA